MLQDTMIIGSKTPISVEKQGELLHSIGVEGATEATWSSAALGAAATGRIIVVCIFFEETKYADDFSTMTIAGVTATEVTNIKVAVSGTHEGHILIAYAVVDSGTTGDIVVNYPSGVVLTTTEMAVYSIYDADSPTPVDSDTNAEGVLSEVATSVTASVNENVSISMSAVSDGATTWTSSTHDEAGALSTETSTAIGSSSNESSGALSHSFTWSTVGTYAATGLWE